MNAVRVESEERSRGASFGTGAKAVTRSVRSSTRLDRGDVLDGFEIIEVLARSRAGSVVKARERSTARLVVLRVPNPGATSDPALFEREEQLRLRLHHPAIAATLPVFGKSRPYLAVEYVAGRSLRTILDEEGPLPVERALFIADQLCGTLVFLHQEGIVHGDLRPDDILVDGFGQVKIVDFIAREAIHGQPADGRVDTYALGVILYEMLAGVLPHEAPARSGLAHASTAARDFSDAAPDVDPKWGPVVMRAIAHRPAERFGTAKEMLAALRDPLSMPGHSLTIRQDRSTDEREAARAWAWAFILALPIAPLAWLFLHTP